MAQRGPISPADLARATRDARQAVRNAQTAQAALAPPVAGQQPASRWPPLLMMKNEFEFEGGRDYFWKDLVTSLGGSIPCLFNTISILFLGITSSPFGFLFETDFENMDDVSIDVFQGVTKIKVMFFLRFLQRRLTSHASSLVSGKDTTM
jgi:hypothetical protein